MAKLKTRRNFVYKLYETEKNVEINKNLHTGKFLFKSECEYYVEKFALDFINNNFSEELKNINFSIYKISTIEDSNIEDLLIEIINYDGEKININ